MSVNGVGGANNMMAAMMKVLLDSMQQQAAMTEQLLAVSVENSLVADKMALAQNIIDVYA